MPGFCAAFIRPYRHRLSILNKTGLDLVTFPYPRQTFLAGHKTLNYLYYDQAGHYAGEHQGDEALILNPDLTVSETNTCNIIILSGRDIIVPASDHVLPGVTQRLPSVDWKTWDMSKSSERLRFKTWPALLMSF